MYRPVTPNHLGASRIALALTLAWPILGQAAGPICHCFQVAPALPPTDSDIEITQAVDAAPPGASMITSKKSVSRADADDAKVAVQNDATASTQDAFVTSKQVASKPVASQPGSGGSGSNPNTHPRSVAETSPAKPLEVVTDSAQPTIAAALPASLTAGVKEAPKAPSSAPVQMIKVMFQPAPKVSKDGAQTLDPTPTPDPAATAVAAADQAVDASQDRIATTATDTVTAPAEPADASPAASAGASSTSDANPDQPVMQAQATEPVDVPTLVLLPPLLGNKEVDQAQHSGPIDGPSAPPRPDQPHAITNKEVAQAENASPIDGPAAPPEPPQLNPNTEVAQAQSAMPQASPTAETAPGSAPANTDHDIDLRRPTGAPPIQEVIPDIDPSQVPPPTPLLPRESLPLPDRWRIVEMLGIKDDPLNPYAQNLLKGDKPIPAEFGLGPDWFVNLSLISDTVLETHNIPTPISSSGVINASAVDQLGRGTQSIFNQTFLFSASLIKGDTSFKPPDYELRIVPAFNGNIVHAEESGVLEADPADGLTRRDSFVGLQEGYLETHLRNVSDRYDFDSVRIGIQPFTSDFRGFVFQDDALGIRFFGNRDNNTWQYNLAWLQRIEKDTNSGLNDITAPLRKDTTFIANLYHQDFPISGNTTQVTVMHNINHDEDQYVDADGFQTRPAEVGDGEAHKYQVTYVGLNTDGHFGRWNLTTSLYGAFGHDSHNPIAQRAQTIEAGFAAAELSRDFDWIRVRASAVYATGDRDVNDNKSTGFDAILENPDIAGAGTSFWIRQAIPLIGGGGVALNGRDGLLPDLRSSKDDGQSNFVNPGLFLFGLGADADITPNLRVLGNFSHLSFANTTVLEALRAQGNISRDIGWDLSTALQYRPFLTQNIVFSASLATLVPGDGFKQLYNTQRLGLPYSILFNMVLRY